MSIDKDCLLVEQEVLKRLKDLPIVKESEKDFCFIFDLENSVHPEKFAVFMVLVKQLNPKHPSNRSTSCVLTATVNHATVSRFDVVHHFHFPDESVSPRTTKVDNEYQKVLSHVVDQLNSSIKSVIHYFKTGDQLVTAG